MGDKKMDRKINIPMSIFTPEHMRSYMDEFVIWSNACFLNSFKGKVN
jgi:hypothetical protein